MNQIITNMPIKEKRKISMYGLFSLSIYILFLRRLLTITPIMWKCFITFTLGILFSNAMFFISILILSNKDKFSKVIGYCISACCILTTIYAAYVNLTTPLEYLNHLSLEIFFLTFITFINISIVLKTVKKGGFKS